jgi:hypothetical protein
MSTLVKPLPAGTYLLRCKEKTLFSAAANGHSAIWPEARAVCDGKYVRVVRDGKEVYACNATYAALNFGVTPVPQPAS